MDGFSQVLLIDDNPVQLTVREAVLRNAGFQVSVAPTAQSALAMLHGQAQQIGVIVTDHVMPDCSGADFVRQLRTENEWLPVIVLSGMTEAAGEYEGLGVIFRQKPLPPTELIELVRSGLKRATRRRGAA